MSGGSANQRVQGEIVDSLQRIDPAQLIEILSDVIKIYVIEGASPASVDPTSTTAPDAGPSHVSFARLIADLKARLDLPELDYFRVEGDRVSISVGDQMVALEGRPGRRRSVPEQAPRPSAPGREDRPPLKTTERSRFLEVD